MPKAIFAGVVIAETDRPQMVEGNAYFPPDSIKREYFKESPTETMCPWKGAAAYYTINVNGEEAKDAAWTYPETSPRAEKIKNHVAFYKHLVTVEF
jgi:uncharacterized protein (DUF427 family)